MPTSNAEVKLTEIKQPDEKQLKITFNEMKQINSVRLFVLSHLNKSNHGFKVSFMQSLFRSKLVRTSRNKYTFDNCELHILKNNEFSIMSEWLSKNKKVKYHYFLKIKYENNQFSVEMERFWASA